MDAAYDERDDIRELVMKIVTTYHPASCGEQEAVVDVVADNTNTSNVDANGVDKGYDIEKKIERVADMAYAEVAATDM
jgi:hypothetical protein